MDGACRAQAEILLAGAVEGAEQAAVELPWSLEAPLPLGDLVGIDGQVLPVAFPRKVGKRLGHFCLRQPGPEAMGLEAVLTGLGRDAGLPDGCLVVHDNESRGCGERMPR